MGSRSATELLQLPVRLQGIRLGQPVDLLLDQAAWRAIGLVVRCGDETERFLAYAASEPGEDEVVVGSALMLLEDVAFYRARARSLRDLLGASVTRDGAELGVLRDLFLAADGTVETLLVELNGRSRTVPAEHVAVQSRVPAA
jgi:sporulation protein YlmC with PRC-barrel domain